MPNRGRLSVDSCVKSLLQIAFRFLAMSYLTDQDPLLPKGDGSPEIHGSRPQSINNVSGTFEKNEIGQPTRVSIKGLPTFIVSLCFVLGISLMLFPYLDGLLGEIRPHPSTIEERVNRILTETPLIGKFIY